ncbi:MAG: DUF4215 domain-containing protein [Minicystis sp.]
MVTRLSRLGFCISLTSVLCAACASGTSTENTGGAGGGGNPTTSSTSSSGSGGSISSSSSSSSSTTTSSSGTGGSGTGGSGTGGEATSSSSSSGTVAMCGNGVVEAGEECDDGNHVDTDACTNACKNAACGDGIVQPGEQCDLGAQNADTGACTSTCKNAACGDGFVQPGEQCDLGAQNADTGACTTACKNAACGDGFVQAGEQCDLGAQNSNSGACTTMCKNAVCGDGLVGPNEACDDGNMVDNDGCTNACKLPGCGDGVVQSGEQCDLGAQNSNTGTCTLACKLPACGDGFVQAGEQCDLGAQNADTGACTSTCKNAACGDGFVQPGEQCDLGAQNSNTGVCTTVCKLPACGDGFVQAGEQCDLGAQNANTGTCTLACKLPVCGDGFIQAGETCDDGNTNNGDGCDSTCKLSPGAPVWTQTYDGSNGAGDSWNAVAVDPSGNVVVAGVRVVGQTTDAVVAKYDSSGTQLWVQTYNGGVNGDDVAYGVATDAQGNIVVVGYETAAGYVTDNKDIWIRKYDPNGAVIWTKTYLGYDDDTVYDQDDMAFGVATNAAGDVFIASAITYDGAAGDVDILVGKLSGATGAIVWTDSYFTNGDDEATAITVDAAGRVIVAGYAASTAGDSDMWIRKYQDGGTTKTVVWTKTYDDAAHQNDFAFGVATDGANNVVVVGAEPVASQFDASIRKYDANGNFVWTQRRAGAAGGTDVAAAVRCDAAGNVYVGGSEMTANMTANAWTAKYSSTGTTVVWSDVYNGTGNDDDYVNGVAIDASGNTYAAGYTTTTSPVGWLRKYAP